MYSVKDSIYGLVNDRFISYSFLIDLVKPGFGSVGITFCEELSLKGSFLNFAKGYISTFPLSVGEQIIFR